MTSGESISQRPRRAWVPRPVGPGYEGMSDKSERLEGRTP